MWHWDTGVLYLPFWYGEPIGRERSSESERDWVLAIGVKSVRMGNGRMKRVEACWTMKQRKATKRLEREMAMSFDKCQGVNHGVDVNVPSVTKSVMKH